MSAFFLFDNRAVSDPEKLETYKSRVASVVEQYGGKYRILGGTVEALEGDWSPRYLVMLEFPDVARAKAWYGSGDYAELKALRMSAVECHGVLVEGL